jgi:hypothetical protein
MKRVLLCAALLAWSTLASAIVYKWVDSQGKVEYGDRPPDGVHAEVVEMLGTNNRAATTPAPAAAKPATSGTPSETKKAVDSDVAQTREKQCADAQDRYKKLIEGRRLYKTGDNGERQYLTSEEVDAERLNAKRDIDAICNSTS